MNEICEDMGETGWSLFEGIIQNFSWIQENHKKL